MPKIKIIGNNKEILFSKGETLLEILLREGFFIDNPCNGKGTCGKCRVKVMEGDIEDPTVTEKKLISENDLKNGIRLSCLVKPDKDISVELFQREGAHKVLTAGYTPKFDFKIDRKKIPV